ncbi:hypothetical protein HPB47_022480, partial [Ixodes persulcatus]
MAAVLERCHGEADVSSLPQGWHLMNGVGKNAKAPASADRSSTNSLSQKPVTNGPDLPDLRWMELRTAEKPVDIRCAQSATTDKLYQEASTEELSQEAAALQNLKIKKTRQVDKLTLLSKEKTAMPQDTKENEVLRQMCMTLEVQLCEKADKLRKLQSSQKNLLEAMDKPQPPKAVKEKDQEIRRLKLQANSQQSASRAATASRSQRPASSGRVKSTSEAERVVTAKRSDTFSVSRSQMAALQTEVVKKRKEEQSTVSVFSASRGKSHGTKQQHGNLKPPETGPKMKRAKRNVAAKKIQRGWRNHRNREAPDLSNLRIGRSTGTDIVTLLPRKCGISLPLEVESASLSLTSVDLRRLAQARKRCMEHFWKRWRRGDLLQLRPAHTGTTATLLRLQVGDVVIVKDDNTPPLLWKLGR